MSKELFEIYDLVSTELSIQEILTYVQTQESVSLPNCRTEYMSQQTGNKKLVVYSNVERHNE